MLPTIAAENLVDDPGETALWAARFLNYAEAKRAFDDPDATKDSMKRWNRVPIMEDVQRIAFKLQREG